MPHRHVNLNDLLMQLANMVRDLCQRQLNKERLLDNLNLDAVVTRLLSEYDLEPDFDRQFFACINSMNQDDAIGQTLVLQRMSGELKMRAIHCTYLLDADINDYEIVVFDGGNTSGDAWKHIFFPRQRKHYFVYEA